MRKGSNIVVSLGDDGAVVSCFFNSTLTKRIFVTSPSSSDFTDLAKTMPEASIYLLLDTIDQNYIFSNIPSVGKVNVSKIIKRKINSEFDPNDLNDFLYMGKDERSTRKDLRYLFVSVRRSTMLTDWLDVFNQLPNRFVGIYFLPLEAEEFIGKIRDVVFGDKKTAGKNTGPEVKKKIVERPAEWEIFISYNRVGGFRQIVMRDGKLIFTRISQAASLQTPDVIGTNLGQEAANTLEYIRRIGYYDQKLAVYVICAKDAAAHVEIPGVEPKDVHIFSPFEFANNIGLEKIAQENDKYGDVVFAAAFITAKKKILRLNTPEFKKVNNLYNISTSITYASYLVYLILPLVTALLLYNGYSQSKESEAQEDDLKRVQKQFSQIEDFQKKYGVKPEMIKNTVVYNTAAEAQEGKILDVLAKYREVDSFSKYIESVHYEKNKTGWEMAISVKLDFSQVANLTDVLFTIEQFKSSVTKAFPDNSITFEGLPDEKTIKIEVDNKKQGQVFDVKVKISPKTTVKK